MGAAARRDGVRAPRSGSCKMRRAATADTLYFVLRTLYFLDHRPVHHHRPLEDDDDAVADHVVGPVGGLFFLAVQNANAFADAAILVEDGALDAGSLEDGALDAGLFDAGYWYRNLSRPVLFEQATRAAIADGHDAFIEMSPHPVLSVVMQDTIAAASSPAIVLGSLRRGQGGMSRLLTSFAQAHVAGVEVDLASLFAGSSARRIDLPLASPGEAAGEALGESPGASSFQFSPARSV